MKQTMDRASRQHGTIFGLSVAVTLLLLIAQTTQAHASIIKNVARSQPILAVHSRQPRHADGQASKIVDLSYPLNNNTLHWPTNSGFNYSVETSKIVTTASNQSYYIKSDSFCTAIHTGTHLDAPRHFSAAGWTVENIPLERLIDVPLTVIDLSEMVNKNRNYLFLKDDFIDKKSKSPLVKANSVVLVYTGISKSYNQGAKAYFGTDSKNVSEMTIPGFSAEAANYLASQKVYGVGLDSPSADSSHKNATNSHDSQAHTIFNGNNIYILENVNGNLSQLLNSKSARLTIAPLPIENGSGSPVRLIAITDHDESACHTSNSGQTVTGQMNLIVSISMMLCIAALIL